MIDLRTLALSEKQIDYILDSDAFVSLADGSVRSGKTVSGLIRYAMHLVDPRTPRSGLAVVSGKTFDTVKRNVFGVLQDAEVFGPLARATSYTRGAPTGTILGVPVEVITFNDERSENRLRGMTCRTGYVDEWSLMPKTFHEQLLGRCSVDGAQVFGNTNPDNPRHWLGKELERAKPGGDLAGDWRVWKFLMDDNPGLSEEVKARYKRQYKGLYYRRNILGEWCMAEGTIYEVWDEKRHVVKELPRITRWLAVGIDYGTVNPLAALLLGLGEDGRLYLTNEWRWDSKARQRSLTDAEYSARIREWLERLKVTPEWIVVDPSAASLGAQLFADGLLPVKGDNSVGDGIRTVASLLAEDKLKVHESCEGLIQEVPGYVWDDKAALLGEDKPVKLDDHSLDAARYVIMTTRRVWEPLIGRMGQG